MDDVQTPNDLSKKLKLNIMKALKVNAKVLEHSR